MTVLFIILGIMFISAGFSCIFAPLYTFLQYNYFIVILMVAFGVVGIIKSIIEKHFGANFIFSILSVVLGAVMLALPENLLFAESVMLIITAVWFMVRGAVAVISAIAVTRRTGSKIWILQLILGIIDVIVGVISLINPLVLAVSIGIMVGIYFIETGFTLLFGGIAVSD